MRYQELINKVAKQYNLSEEQVTIIYKLYWKFIYDTISKLPLKDCLTEEEFNNIKTSFNIPSLGKLYTTYDILKKLYDETLQKEIDLRIFRPEGKD